MDPVTVSLAMSVLGKLGISKVFDKLLGSTKAPEIAAKVLNIAQTVTGVVGGAVTSKLDSNPELISTLSTHLYQLAAEENARMYADLADARQMQEQTLIHGDSFSKNFVYYFTIALLFMSMAYFFAATFYSVGDPANTRIIDTTIMFLQNLLLMAMSFFFGHTGRGPSVTTLRKPE